MRTMIDTPEMTRFKISEEDLPVVWDQLEPIEEFDSKFEQLENRMQVSGIKRENGDDTY